MSKLLRWKRFKLMIKTYAYSWRLQMNFNALAYSSAKLLTRLTLMFLSYRNQSKDLTTIFLLYLAIYWILNVPCISESCIVKNATWNIKKTQTIELSRIYPAETEYLHVFLSLQRLWWSKTFNSVQFLIQESLLTYFFLIGSSMLTMPFCFTWKIQLLTNCVV